jgi:hypothetical protein
MTHTTVPRTVKVVEFIPRSTEVNLLTQHTTGKRQLHLARTWEGIPTSGDTAEEDHSRPDITAEGQKINDEPGSVRELTLGP